MQHIHLFRKHVTHLSVIAGSQQQAQDDTVFGDLPSAVDDNSPSRDTSPPLPATQLSSFEDEGLFDIGKYLFVINIKNHIFYLNLKQCMIPIK